MEMYVVGEKFPHEVKEGISAYFDGNSINIVLGFKNVTESEYKGFTENEIEFYLSYINKTFFLCVRADNLIDLSDAAIYLDIKDKLRVVEQGEESYPVYMFLVDTSTSVFLGARVLGLSNEASYNMSMILNAMNGNYPSLEKYKKNATGVMDTLETDEIKALSFSEYKSKPSIF